MDFTITGINDPGHLYLLSTLFGWVLHKPKEGELIYPSQLMALATEHYGQCVECQMLLHETGGDIPEMTEEEAEKMLADFYAKHPERKKQNNLIDQIEGLKLELELPLPSGALNGTLVEQYEKAVHAANSARRVYETALILWVHISALQ